jgi:hypothetical protein
LRLQVVWDPLSISWFGLEWDSFGLVFVEAL